MGFEDQTIYWDKGSYTEERIWSLADSPKCAPHFYKMVFRLPALLTSQGFLRIRVDIVLTNTLQMEGIALKSIVLCLGFGQVADLTFFKMGDRR